MFSMKPVPETAALSVVRSVKSKLIKSSLMIDGATNVPARPPVPISSSPSNPIVTVSAPANDAPSLMVTVATAGNPVAVPITSVPFSVHFEPAPSIVTDSGGSAGGVTVGVTVPTSVEPVSKLPPFSTVTVPWTTESRFGPTVSVFPVPFTITLPDPTGATAPSAMVAPRSNWFAAAAPGATTCAVPPLSITATDAVALPGAGTPSDQLATPNQEPVPPIHVVS